MNDLAEIEREVLSLPPKEREHVALAAWESLENDAMCVADAAHDDEGIDAAQRRDREIESGSVLALGHDEFIRRTSASNED